jgi:hypothetical protein
MITYNKNRVFVVEMTSALLNTTRHFSKVWFNTESISSSN